MSLELIIKDKIKELERYLDHCKEVGWDKNADFLWKGTLVHVDGYAWNTGLRDEYRGKLAALKELATIDVTNQ